MSRVNDNRTGIVDLNEKTEFEEYPLQYQVWCHGRGNGDEVFELTAQEAKYIQFAVKSSPGMPAIFQPITKRYASHHPGFLVSSLRFPWQTKVNTVVFPELYLSSVRNFS